MKAIMRLVLGILTVLVTSATPMAAEPIRSIGVVGRCAYFGGYGCTLTDSYGGAPVVGPGLTPLSSIVIPAEGSCGGDPSCSDWWYANVDLELEVDCSQVPCDGTTSLYLSNGQVHSASASTHVRLPVYPFIVLPGYPPPPTLSYYLARSTCGDGTKAGFEECDDGNLVDGDCCSSTCDSEPIGMSCDDADVCTHGEVCDGAGTCGGPPPDDCDDEDACTADSCDPLTGCVNDAAPASGCLTASKSLVLLKRNATDDSKDKLLWKWIMGEAFTQVDLADPTSSTSYALCIYAGTANALIANAALPSGTGWSAIGTKGYKFKGTSPNGLSLALLKGGAANKSKALAKGKGTALPDPTLPLAYPVTVQFKKDGSPLCLESTFTSTDEVKNDETQFKAKK